MADEKQAPFPQTGELADRIAQQLAKVGKSSVIGIYTIPPGETQTFKATGSFFYVVDATTGFKARLDGQPYVDVRAGSSLKVAQGAFFEWVEMLNEAAVPLTVKVYGGFAEYRDERLFTLEPLTDFIGQAITLAPNDALFIPNSTDPAAIRRKYLEVTNLSATDTIFVHHETTQPPGQFGPRVGTIPPGQSRKFWSSGPFIVYNDSGASGPADVVVCEVYWVFYPFTFVALD